MSATMKVPIASSLMLCGLLAACGDSVPTTPAAPGTASPQPTPSPASAGYLHVLQHPWVMTYEIDPTGRLRPPVTQPVKGGLGTLAGEPQGRFVFGGHGGWRPTNGSDLTIASYAPDPRDGTLMQVSETTVEQRRGGIGEWVWLKGGAKRVHGLWLWRWGTLDRHRTFTYVSAAVASDGQLGPVSEKEFGFDNDPGAVTVDVRSNVLYKGGDPIRARGGLEAHVIEPDGSLNRMGYTNLCLAYTMDEYDSGAPLVTARGFLFANVHTGPVPTVCSYQGLRLKPLYAIDLRVSIAEAFVPSSEGEPALLAMNVHPTWPQSELRLFSMNVDGDLRPLATEDLPDQLTQILFHPSSRFLYTADSKYNKPRSRLAAYTIDSNDRLEKTMSIEHAGGSMAITLKDPRSEER